MLLFCVSKIMLIAQVDITFMNQLTADEYISILNSITGNCFLQIICKLFIYFFYQFL